MEVRPADGRASITGSPLQPTDVLFGGGHCEFRFSQIHDALPKNHELSIEVNDTGTVVRGTARCSERTPTPSGESTGISISLAVTGGRLAGDNAAASGPQGQVAAVVAACRQHDADALWRMLTPRFRAEVDQQAIQLRSSLPAAELRRLYGHSGRPQAFNGLAFLRHTVRTPNSPDNPCSGAESWKLGPGVTSPDGFLVTVEHSENFGFALRFTKKDGGWQLDQISKSIALPKR